MDKESANINWNNAMFRQYGDHIYIELPLLTSEKLLADGILEGSSF
ncbi:MAG: hypothetical protein V4539_08370 [Bacteroidota bacterium]